MFGDSDKVGADVVLLHGCPQRCMPNPVKGLLEIYEDMAEVLLVLEKFLTEDWVTGCLALLKMKAVCVVGCCINEMGELCSMYIRCCSMHLVFILH